MPGKSHNEKGASGKCLSDEQLYRYLEKLLPKVESREVQEHLDSCSACFDDMVALARNAHTPASEAEKMEITSLRKLTPQQQVDKILDYVEKESSDDNTGKFVVFEFMRKAWEKTITVIESIVSPVRNHWKPVLAGVSLIILFVMIGLPAYNSMQSNALTKSGLTILVENYQIDSREVPRPRGGFEYNAFGSPTRGTVNVSRYELAKTNLEKAIQIKKDNSAAHEYLGTYYLLVKKDWNKAREQYLLALAQDSTDAYILNDLGVVAWHAGSLDEAAKEFSEALEYNHRLSEAQYNLAAIYQKQGRLENAVMEWKKYLQVDSTSTWADIAREHLDQLQQQ